MTKITTKTEIAQFIKEMAEEDQRARERLAERQAFFKGKKLVAILSSTRSGASADLVLTLREILDVVITDNKSKGRIVTLPPSSELNMDCYGLCSIRCGEFKDNCRKCIKDFYLRH